jgi:hypothetical protein
MGIKNIKYQAYNNKEVILVDNSYLPLPVRIEQINIETEDKNLRTFKLIFLNKEDGENFMNRSL